MLSCWWCGVSGAGGSVHVRVYVAGDVPPPMFMRRAARAAGQQHSRDLCCAVPCYAAPSQVVQLSAAPGALERAGGRDDPCGAQHVSATRAAGPRLAGLDLSDLPAGRLACSTRVRMSTWQASRAGPPPTSSSRSLGRRVAGLVGSPGRPAGLQHAGTSMRQAGLQSWPHPPTPSCRYLGRQWLPLQQGRRRAGPPCGQPSGDEGGQVAGKPSGLQGLMLGVAMEPLFFPSAC